MYKITFSRHGCIVAILYNRAETRAEAIDCASYYVANTWDAVDVKRV